MGEANHALHTCGDSAALHPGDEGNVGGKGIGTMDILDELKTLTKRLNEESIDYALCGGLALAIYAFPRATLDIDILVEASKLETIERIVHDLGYTIRAEPMSFQGGKIKIQRHTKIEADTGEALSLDMLLVTTEIQEAWNDRLEVEWEYGTIKVVSPEGLILLKSIRKSGQDQDDIDFLRSIIDEDRSEP